MIDPSRNYIIDLYTYFENNPGSKEKWIENSATRNGMVKSAKNFKSLDNDAVAAQLVYSVFLERRTSEPILALDKPGELLRDLKELKSTAFICELVIDKKPYHHFVIQKAADSIIYIYQSHAPFYTIKDSLNRLDRDPISYEDLSSHLTLLSGPALNRSYTARLASRLFHFNLDAPPLYHRQFNYFKCPYQPCESFSPTIRYKVTFSPIRLLLAISLIAAIYFAIRYIKQHEPDKYVLDVIPITKKNF